MKNKIPSLFHPAALSAGLLLAALHPAPAAVIYSPGDLLMGFHAPSGTGSNTSYVFNLGPATVWRDNPLAAVPANNLSTDLTAAYGANWFARTDLYWGIAAVRDSSGAGPNTIVNGDPRAAIYISRETTVPGASAPWNLPGSGTTSATTISSANDISTMQGGFTGKTETMNSSGRGTLQAEDLTPNSWDEFNPIGGAAFGGILTGGVQGALGGGSVEYLDLYRLLGRTSPDATPNTAAGQGLYTTTFTINADGIVSTIPEPTGSVLMILGVLFPFLCRRRPVAAA